MKAYAEGTPIPVERTRAELKKLLMQAGAARRSFESDDEHGVCRVVFRLGGFIVRLMVPMPKLDDFAEKRRRGRYGVVTSRATPEEQRRAHEQACRERWRSLLLLVRAKLEAIRLGISSVEREFLPDLLLHTGHTVEERINAAGQIFGLGLPLRPGMVTSNHQLPPVVTVEDDA